MQLSVVIVNYNVKHFLEQCLCSVQAAGQGIDMEILVVDNNSLDGSLEYLQPRFPGIQFIANKENVGFARACNQGFHRSTGDNILFLNPDTVVPEDCFKKCLDFLSAHPEAGALGIKMLDGSGRFLKESKRAFPAPLTSLYKLFGFSKLFPRSAVFSRYHLGHLDENKSNEADVLAGAFMMIRRTVLEKVGAFDETFFMYGEDVDLSYRIQKAGFRNYYFAGSSIIHFKGESTRKVSMNYVRMFYKAMSIFVRKHYGGGRAGLFNFFIQLAIWFRAALTAAGNFIRRFGLPLIDAGLILLAFLGTKYVWSHYVKPQVNYENRLIWIAFPAYTIFFLVTAYFAGLYDRWYKRTGLARAMAIATIFLLAAYSLLPEDYRFSRGIILFGSMLAFLLISLLRWILVLTGVLTSHKDKEWHTHTLIVASPAEYTKVLQLLKEAGQQERVLGRLAVNEWDETAVGYWKQLPRIAASIPFREVIFCKGVLSFADIIAAISLLPHQIVAKIHTAGSGSVVGSNLSTSVGESVSKENGYKLSDPYNRRLKKLVDILVALAGILFFPVHLFLVRKPFHFLGNCFAVLFARKTWVGYAVPEARLPILHKAVLASNGVPLAAIHQFPAESLQMIDYWYAREYEPAEDWRMIRRGYRNLGS